MSDDRISLTPLTVADADEMVDVLSGERLYTFTGGSAPTLEGLRARYTRQVAGRSPDGLEEWRNWIVRRGHDGQAVGYVQATITEQGRRAEIAWVIGLAWQRRGYASQAATALVAWLFDRGVEQVVAHIHPDHAASAAVAAKAGLSPTDQFDDGERLWRAERA
ncbi:GNAT family N-acetyltransferase [Nonomuraea dietziae]|uniref:RimJ/RimL family protein N-acetyltransferase n=1 Tax=Nonomuraea dietziae TaxID=65515 RepID=A0A7W5YQP9_9ACTN|nr:GNAT family N-acetyltransferase [Nonomuraea dietziae]MBB3726594.1 RimJ/RimL family protein N-acetyltransferase [Nonomuraea dietziae]